MPGRTEGRSFGPRAADSSGDLPQLFFGGGQMALELLQVSRPYDEGIPASLAPAFIGPLFTVYVRGLAYLAAHQGREAAIEFQNILDARNIVVSDPIGALARLQLGRAFALSGDKAKARTAYQDFLLLWKDADADIPILKQAKSEYARLHRGSADVTPATRGTVVRLRS